MARKNCWEFFRCGREIDGEKVSELVVCPAATDVSSDGINPGENDGRICCAIDATLCDGEVQGTFAEKHLFCGNCRFYKKVKREEGFLQYQILKQEQIGKKVINLLMQYEGACPENAKKLCDRRLLILIAYAFL